DFDPAIHELYEAPKARAVEPDVTDPPPADAIADALATLPEDWRDAKGRGIAKLRDVAEAVTGRTAANKEEAVAMIEAVMAAVEPPPLPPPPAA
ncbi:MAG: hypothetical protein WD017_01695, partial [Cucumibacter sp.]